MDAREPNSGTHGSTPLLPTQCCSWTGISDYAHPVLGVTGQERCPALLPACRPPRRRRLRDEPPCQQYRRGESASATARSRSSETPIKRVISCGSFCRTSTNCRYSSPVVAMRSPMVIAISTRAASSLGRGPSEGTVDKIRNDVLRQRVVSMPNDGVPFRGEVIENGTPGDPHPFAQPPDGVTVETMFCSQGPGMTQVQRAQAERVGW